MVPSGNFGSTPSGKSPNFVMVVKLTDNQAERLFGFPVTFTTMPHPNTWSPTAVDSFTTTRGSHSRNAFCRA
jgi:hypothetical protein